jgi:hypothetical protein
VSFICQTSLARKAPEQVIPLSPLMPCSGISILARHPWAHVGIASSCPMSAHDYPFRGSLNTLSYARLIGCQYAYVIVNGDRPAWLRPRLWVLPSPDMHLPFDALTKKLRMQWMVALFAIHPAASKFDYHAPPSRAVLGHQVTGKMSAGARPQAKRVSRKLQLRRMILHYAATRIVVVNPLPGSAAPHRKLPTALSPN